MKKAWMPLIVASCLWLAAGCNLDGWGMGLHNLAPAQKPLASTPPSGETTPPPTAKAPAAPQPADPEVKPLADRVQTFVGQFPQDDRDRQAGAAQPQGMLPANHGLSPGGTAALSQTVPPGTTAVPMPTRTDVAMPPQAVPPGQTVPPATAMPMPTRTDVGMPPSAPLPTRTDVGVPPGAGLPGAAVPASAGATPAATANRPSTVRALAATYPNAAALPLPDAFGSTALPATAATPGAAGEAVIGSPQPPSPLAPAAQTPHVELTEIRPVLNSSATATQPSGNGANQPVRDGAPAPAGDRIAELIASVEAALAQNPNQLDSQFKLRLLYAAAGDEEKAVGPIKGADPVQADLVAAVFRAMKTARAAMRDPAAGSAPALAAVEELKRLIAQQSPVMMPKLALVTRVNSFGDYDAVSPPQFPAGKPVHVFLYTEVANFRTESTPDNHLRTVLAEKVEIFDAAGKIIWQRSEPTIEDKTLTPRRDFFMTMEIELPADTPAGDYILKVTVEDKLAATADQQRMSFAIR